MRPFNPFSAHDFLRGVIRLHCVTPR